MFRLNTTPIVRFSVNHPWAVIIAAIIITIGLAFPILNLEIQPDIESLLPDDLEEFYDNVSGNSEPYDKIIIMVSGDKLFTLDNLQLFDKICDELSEYLPVVDLTKPFSFLTLEKNGGRLTAVPLSPGGEVPASEDDLELLVQRLDKSRFAPGLVTSPERDTLAAYFTVEKAEDYRRTMKRVYEIVEPLKQHMHVYVGGTSPFSAETEEFLTTGFARLLVFVILTILASYYIGFRTKRAVILPIILVISGSIFALGIMSILDFKLTMVSIISPPLILTLGSSYSVHVMSAYYSAAAGRGMEKNKKEVIIESVSSVSSTILLASLTTFIGLMSLLFATISQTRQFAVTTALGVFFSALLSISVLPALLSLQPVPMQNKLKMLKEDPLSRFLHRFGPGFVRNLKTSTIILAVITAVFIYLTPKVEFNTSAFKYFPSSSDIIQNHKKILGKIGGYDELIIQLTSNEDGYFLSEQGLNEIHELENELTQLENVSYIFSLPQYIDYAAETMTGKEGNFSSKPLNRYVSKLFSAANPEGEWANSDFTGMKIQLMIFNRAETAPPDEKNIRDLLDDITHLMNTNLPDGLDWQLRGTTLGYLKLSEQMRRDFFVSTLIALFLIGLLTSIVFKSAVKGLLSLIPLLVGIFASFILMVAFNIPLDMTTIMVSCITIGVGVDDAIHFLLQHREMELKYPGEREKAVYQTIIHTGRPIVITTLSIVAGLLFLSVARFQPIRYFGLLIVFTLIAACFATIVLLPSLVRTTHRKRNVR